MRPHAARVAVVRSGRDRPTAVERLGHPRSAVPGAPVGADAMSEFPRPVTRRPRPSRPPSQRRSWHTRTVVTRCRCPRRIPRRLSIPTTLHAVRQLPMMTAEHVDDTGWGGIHARRAGDPNDMCKHGGVRSTSGPWENSLPTTPLLESVAGWSSPRRLGIGVVCQDPRVLDARVVQPKSQPRPSVHSGSADFTGQWVRGMHWSRWPRWRCAVSAHDDRLISASAACTIALWS